MINLLAVACIFAVICAVLVVVFPFKSTGPQDADRPVSGGGGGGDDSGTPSEQMQQ